MLSCWSAWLAGSVSQSFARPIYQGMGWLVGWSVSRCGLMTHWFADCFWLPIVCCSGMPVWVGIVMRYGDYAWINGTAFPPTYPFPTLTSATDDRALVIDNSQYRVEDKTNRNAFLCDIVSNSVIEGELHERDAGNKSVASTHLLDLN